MKEKYDIRSEFETLVTEESNWPWFDRVDYLTELTEQAFDIYEKHSTEGYLGAVLIFHQIAEEIVKLILKYNHLYIKAKLHPVSYGKNKEGSRNTKMFGVLRADLINSVDFDYKDALVQILGELNSNRIELVHNLTSRKSLEDIHYQADKVEHTFQRVHWHFDMSVNWFRKKLKDLANEPYWLELARKNRVLNTEDRLIYFIREGSKEANKAIAKGSTNLHIKKYQSQNDEELARLVGWNAVALKFRNDGIDEPE